MENGNKYAVMVEGKNAPSKLISNYEDAETEAKRLAIKERQTTYVLLAVAKVELNDVKVTQLSLSEGAKS